MQQLLGKIANNFLFTPSKKTATAEDNLIRPIIRYIMKFTIIITVILLLFLFFFFCDGRTFALFSVTLVVSAYFISGVVLGFIFGIPKKYQNKQTTTPVDDEGKPLPVNDPAYTDNTSLEEVSDWITKIVIGLSLVQFNAIKTMVAEAAANINTSLRSAYVCEGAPANFYAFSYAVIIFYSIAGAVIAYLWTRVEFPRILAVKDKIVRDVDQKKDRIVDDAIRTLTYEMNAEEERRVSEASQVADRPAFEIIRDENAGLIRQIILNKPAGPVKDDPQKNRWGQKSFTANFMLTAEVTETKITNLYRVKISVSTVNTSALQNFVAILLHPTFNPDHYIIDPKGNLSVFIEVIAYEAFTVGAVCMTDAFGNYESLELDLNELPNLPKDFYWS